MDLPEYKRAIILGDQLTLKRNREAANLLECTLCGLLYEPCLRTWYRFDTLGNKIEDFP
jgi:hypothetical protein